MNLRFRVRHTILYKRLKKLYYTCLLAGALFTSVAAAEVLLTLVVVAWISAVAKIPVGKLSNETKALPLLLDSTKHHHGIFRQLEYVRS
jgi:hypothetical protein